MFKPVKLVKLRCFTIIILLLSHAGLLDAAENILLKFKEGTTENTQKNIISRSTPTAVSLMEEISVWRLKFPSSSEALDAVKFFNGFNETKYCYKSRRLRAFGVPNDPNYGSQWGLSSSGINMAQAWNIEGSSGSAYITIAVIDTGVDYNHEDLSSKMWTSPQGYHGYNWIDNGHGPNDPMDDDGHGTHVSGIAAAATNNGTGIAGVSINSKIMALKILDSSGYGDEADEAEAILWAVRNGARVINLSLGADSYSYAEADACAYAFDQGVFIAAASGNYNTPYISYPAALSTTFAVGAVNKSGDRCDPSDWGYDIYGDPLGSNYGPELEVLAPGNNILSTVPPGSYQSWNGTSMACPFVAGLASLVLSIRPDYGPEDAREAIRRSGSDYSNFTNEHGYGIINASACLTALQYFEYKLGVKITNFPNPYKLSGGILNFCFDSPPSEIKNFIIFDFTGQKIISLGNNSFFPDKKIITWDGRNENGADVASGIYFYFAETNIGQSKGHFAVIK